jgi:hypothetical protein
VDVTVWIGMKILGDRMLGLQLRNGVSQERGLVP